MIPDGPARPAGSSAPGPIAPIAVSIGWPVLCLLIFTVAFSMAELTSAGLPAVLVPFPFAAQDHQRYNARFLEKEGGAVILEQDTFFGPKGNPAVLAQTLLA